MAHHHFPEPAMSCPCKNNPESGSGEDKPDRYVSFIGLDCDAKATQLMGYIRHYIDNPEHTNAFWEYFKQKAAGEKGPQPDDLFLVHCHLNQIRELFETHEDAEALAFLDQVEQECC